MAARLVVEVKLPIQGVQVQAHCRGSPLGLGIKPLLGAISNHVDVLDL